MDIIATENSYIDNCTIKVYIIGRSYKLITPGSQRVNSNLSGRLNRVLMGKELGNDLHWTGFLFNSTNILTSCHFMLQTVG